MERNAILRHCRKLAGSLSRHPEATDNPRVVLVGEIDDDERVVLEPGGIRGEKCKVPTRREVAMATRSTQPDTSELVGRDRVPDVDDDGGLVERLGCVASPAGRDLRESADHHAIGHVYLDGPCVRRSRYLRHDYGLPRFGHVDD